MSFQRFLPLSLVWLSFVLPIRAIVIFGGNGTQNLTAPVSDPGWANVGSLNGATGVYLGSYGGSYWVATAAHVGIGAISLNSTPYTAVSGSGITILDPDSSTTELFLFRLNADPGLPNLALASTAPVGASTVRLIGNGVIEGIYTRWDISGSTWTVSAADPFNAHGYTQVAPAGKRWGDAVVGGSSNYTLGGVTSSGVYTVFSAITAASQAGTGDSGGAMFSFDGSNWALAGILSAVTTFEGQPGSTSVVGNQTFAVSIADYRGAIITAIPEPAATAVWCSVGVLIAVLVLRRHPSTDA
jgi:hypothetical protein